MPYRVNSLVRASLVRAVFAGSLVAAVLFGLNGTASATSECIGKPDREVSQAGHWYYYVDRVHHRRCWFFEKSQTAISPSSSADRVQAPTAEPQQSWFSRFATEVTKPFSSEPQQTSISAYTSELQQNSIADNSSTATKTTSSKHSRANKIVKQERSQVEPPPATSGVASAERRDQLLPQRTVEKDEKLPSQLTDADRQALFDDFLKWYRDRSIFGGP